VDGANKKQSAADDPMMEFTQRIIADLLRSAVMGTLPAQTNVQSKRGRIPKSSLAPSGEDMDTRLRSIRRYVTPRELAALLHWHVETLYRKIKVGMPVDHEVNIDGNGRLLKLYPPKVADWLQECRTARNNLIGSSSRTISSGRTAPPAKKKDVNK